MSTDPPHSPPTAAPCSSRRTVSSSGAAIPIVAYTGSTPINAVQIPMISRVLTSVALRPMRSP